MRTFAIITVCGCILATPLHAGTVSMVNGAVSWQPKKCSQPLVPPEIIYASPSTKADEMNALVLKYNLYVAAAEDAMHCLSSEAEHDANTVSNSIALSAKEKIERLEQSVSALGKDLKKIQ